MTKFPSNSQFKQENKVCGNFPLYGHRFLLFCSVFNNSNKVCLQWLAEWGQQWLSVCGSLSPFFMAWREFGLIDYSKCWFATFVWCHCDEESSPGGGFKLDYVLSVHPSVTLSKLTRRESDGQTLNKENVIDDHLMRQRKNCIWWWWNGTT